MADDPVNGFLMRRPYWVIAVLAWAIAVVKSGVLLVDPPVSALASFPAPEDRLTGTSYGLRLIAWLLRTESVTGYLIISATLTLAAILVISWALRVRLSDAESRVAILLVATASIGTVLLGNVGRNDVLVIMGAALLGLLGRSWAWALAGVALMSIGNPEQAVLATTAYVLCCTTPSLRARTRPAFAGLAVSVAWALATTAWARSSGSSGRLGYFFDYLGNSLYHFGHDWPLSLYAAYGTLWILVGLAAVRTSGWHRVALIAGAVIIPLAVTATTLDQTRVFVGVAAASAFAIIAEFLPQFTGLLARHRLPAVTVALGAAVLLPSIEIDFHGAVRPAYEWLFTVISG